METRAYAFQRGTINFVRYIIWKPRAPLKLALAYDVCYESFRSMRIAKSYGGWLICKILRTYPYLRALPRGKAYIRRKKSLFCWKVLIHVWRIFFSECLVSLVWEFFNRSKCPNNYFTRVLLFDTQLFIVSSLNNYIYILVTFGLILQCYVNLNIDGYLNFI